MTKEEILSSDVGKGILTEFIKNFRLSNESSGSDLKAIVDKYIKDKLEVVHDWKINEFVLGNMRAASNKGVWFYTLGPNGERGLAPSHINDMRKGMKNGWKISKAHVPSTGESFTLGDVVICLNEGSHLHHLPAQIESFRFNKQGNIVVDTKYTNDNGLALQNIKKYVQPFNLATNDEVIITNPQEAVFILKKGKDYMTACRADNAKKIKKDEPGTKIFNSLFSGYLELCKTEKLFSYEDIIKIGKTVNFNQRVDFLMEAKKRSKLPFKREEGQ